MLNSDNCTYNMTNTARRQRKNSKGAKEEFFLYVAFHSAFTALMKLFED